MSVVKLRVTSSDGRAWGGTCEESEVEKYVLRLACALHVRVSYATAGKSGVFQPWTEVYPDDGLPNVVDTNKING